MAGKNKNSKKRNWHRQQHGAKVAKEGPSRKRQRKGGRYWIEDCREKIVENPALTVLVTRVELQDDHPTSKQNSLKKDEGEPEETENSKQESSVVESDKDEPKADVKSEKNNTEDTNRNPNEKEQKMDNSTIKVEASLTEEQGIQENKPEDATSIKDGISVKRDASANKKPKRFARTNFQHLLDGDCGDGVKNPYPNTEVADKYWAQRHRLFSRFDEGIQLDKESWYSVTPEAIAKHIANRMVQDCSEKKNLVVLDAFCGAGGNAIALAQKEEVSLVVCVDIDEAKLRLAANNASVYNIPSNKLLFICADACQVLKQYQNGVLEKNMEKKDATSTKTEELLSGYPIGGIDLIPANLNSVFLSPPWGGVEYESIGPKSFALKCIKLENGEDGDAFLGLSASAVPKDDGRVVCFLPRNTNGWEVAKSAVRAGISGILEVEQNMLNGKFKAITIYTSMTGASH